MEQKVFKKISNIAALVILALSSFVYLSTIEPTSSFWDCGEFIASSYKLEVGHPPGNPVFQLFARFFTIFTDNMHAAAAVNCCSALCSAFTIFFLFLTIVHFGRRILEKCNKELTLSNAIAVLGAGVAGSLAYCFSDTFWFSAVEGEVYAMSSLMTAIVFWAILKWEEEADEPYADRWIVLISLLMGLSIGIHLLNLLAIPPIVFIYYYKHHEKEEISFWKNVWILCIGALILAVVLFGIIPYLPKIAAFVDRIFVNGFGLPFNVGAAFFMVALFVACFMLMHNFRKKGKVMAHTTTLCFTTILIGYSLFAIVIIRASANPPTNEYQPDNPYTLVRYLSREQYGSTPIVYGQAYTSVLEAKESSYYTPLNGKYLKADAPLTARYPAGAKMFFPRMWSSQNENHKQFYDSYTGGNFKTNRVTMSNGEKRNNQMPYFWDNMRYFFDYQLNYMYFRYFFWNFVGRQNDLHGQTPLDKIKGNWESGIGFVDRARLGDQSFGPDYIVNNKAKNHYFFLPLILGLIGFFFQLKRDERNTWITFLLFFLTGIAIILYLNQPPYQVRERDYAYAGSFYVFTIWIGLAVLAVKGWIEKISSKPVASAYIASALCVAVAILMGCENWDDHNRSNRYTAPELAYNYLQSCDKNAILITHGDNDTFPLWYSQEVEEVRPDIRIMNTSLLGMDWYIDQMKCKVNESEPLPLTLPRVDYLYGTNDYVPVVKAIEQAVTAKDIMTVFREPRYRTRGNNGIIVSDKIRVPVNKENVLKYGIVPASDADSILDYIELTIPDNNISKSDLIILDLLSNYNWDRPIYFVLENGDCSFNIGQYLRNDGLTHKLVPMICNSEAIRKQDSNLMYNLLMNVYKFDAIADTTHFVDYQNLYTFTAVTPVREDFVQTASILVTERKLKEAEDILDRCFEVTPRKNYPYNVSEFYSINEYSILTAIELYYALNRREKAQEIAMQFLDETIVCLAYYGHTSGRQMLDEKLYKQNAQYVSYLANVAKTYQDSELYSEVSRQINALTGKE
ncbi:MAG: DUF2723 domain-containing protein [Bacteroidales bacterium]|nr:DUF2723 domain-containing protein [Bacteroidales bacterium]